MSGEIVASEVGVRFDLDRQRRPVTPAMRRVRRHCTTIWGLRNLSFSVPRGASVALLGRNGAGKTTLLRVLAGVLPPDAGSVSVRGRVGSLLSIEAGLMPLLTGRENAVLLGVLNGRSRQAAAAALPTIEERSGLGPAFDRPVSTYSQGMRARLGFSVVEEREPDVLLLDEVHQVLDADFRQRVQERAHAICARGGIVIAAGHDLPDLGRLCEMVLELGEEGAALRSWRPGECDAAPEEP